MTRSDTSPWCLYSLHRGKKGWLGDFFLPPHLGVEVIKWLRLFPRWWMMLVERADVPSLMSPQAVAVQRLFSHLIYSCLIYVSFVIAKKKKKKKPQKTTWCTIRVDHVQGRVTGVYLKYKTVALLDMTLWPAEIGTETLISLLRRTYNSSEPNGL